jgi:hypothetical protein
LGRYLWVLESQCIDNEKVFVTIEGESDFFGSLAVGLAASDYGQPIALIDDYSHPAASNLSRTGADGFVVEGASYLMGNYSRTVLGSASSEWSPSLISRLDIGLGRYAGSTRVLSERVENCCER